MSQKVKYPNQPTYRATVSNEALMEATEKEQPSHGCAKCFMSVMALVFVILGLAMAGLATYTLIILTFGGQNIVGSDTLASASVYTLLVVGIVLFAVSVIVWISSCKPTAVCSKIVLTIFSIVMAVVFLLEVIIIIFTSLWIENVQFNISGISSNAVMNATASELYVLCCTNSSVQAQDACVHVVGSEINDDCSSFGIFYSTLMEFLSQSMKWVAVFFGIVAFFNLVAFICSCCLLCARKRSAYYKPATTYTNGV